MKRYIILALIALSIALSARSQDYSGYTRCAEQDSLALVALYHATDGPNWKCNQDGFSLLSLSENVLEYHTLTYPNAGMGKWLVGPVKNWFGVLLEKQQVGSTSDSVWRVVHVRPTVSRRQAGDNNLRGYIPREVGYLTAMRWFKVNGNGGLAGTELPKEIYHTSLTDLDIESAYFSGELSSKLRNCPNLAYMNFRYNWLDSVPVFDFMTPDYLLSHFGAGGQSFYYYNNQLTYSNIEASVEYFLSFSTSKQVQYEARQQHDIGQEKEIIVKAGDKVVLSTSVGGKNGTYTWYRRGLNTYMKGSTFTIKAVADKDTGDYKVLVENELVRLNDLNSDYSNVFSKNIYVRYTPVAPVIKNSRSSYSGNEIELVFSKPMKPTGKAQSAEFTVTSGGRTLPVIDVVLGGRFKEIVTLKLASSILKNEIVTVSYSKGTVVCENNGALATVSNLPVQNLARVSPVLKSAVTREDGSGILLTFDQYIDASSIAVSDFVVNANGAKPIHSALLTPGTIDSHISRTVELVMSDQLNNTDAIEVTYNKGGLTALYGGAVQTIVNQKVQNVIVDNRTSVLIKVIDGTRELENIVAKGSIKSLPITLSDNGTNGDEVAGDHIWSSKVDLTNGQYSWNAYERITTASYDTIKTVGTDGKIILEITPSYTYADQLLSIGTNMVVVVSNKSYSGTTQFSYRNNKVTFIVDMGPFKEKNPGVVIEPSLMGINNDWTEGVVMQSFASGSALYFATIGGYNSGDPITFCYRNGTVWENSSPLNRSHTVYSNDTLRSVFGLSVNRETIEKTNRLTIYPNPAHSVLNVEWDQPDTIQKLQIINLQGQTVLMVNDTDTKSIDISALKPGNYFVKAINCLGNCGVYQFIKR